MPSGFALQKTKKNFNKFLKSIDYGKFNPVEVKKAILDSVTLRNTNDYQYYQMKDMMDKFKEYQVKHGIVLKMELGTLDSGKMNKIKFQCKYGEWEVISFNQVIWNDEVAQSIISNSDSTTMFNEKGELVGEFDTVSRSRS